MTRRFALKFDEQISPSPPFVFAQGMLFRRGVFDKLSGECPWVIFTKSLILTGR